MSLSRFAIGPGGSEPSLPELLEVYRLWSLSPHQKVPEEFHKALLALAQGLPPPCYHGFPIHRAMGYWIVTVLIYSEKKDINRALDELSQLAENGFMPAAILLVEILLGLIEDLDKADSWRDDETGVVRALGLLFWSTERGHVVVRRGIQIRVFKMLRDYGVFYSKGRHTETAVRIRIRDLYTNVIGKEEDDEFMLEKCRDFVKWVTTPLEPSEPLAKKARY